MRTARLKIKARRFTYVCKLRYVVLNFIYKHMNGNTDEKIELLTGKDFWHSANAAGTESIRFSDGPSGVRLQSGKGDHLGLNASAPSTCFPSHSALAASWNKKLCGEVGFAIGVEAKRAGVGILLAPDLNIKRSPLCGRNFEYFSEDAYLNGILGASYANGVQSAGTGACLKHFAANNRERGRMVCDSAVDERTLREIYLTAFEIAVKRANPTAVMTAYNRLNGKYCSESPLISEVLRGEWGFGGITVSDWGGVADRAKACACGLDLEMPFCRLSAEEVKCSLKSGALSESEIDACASRVSKAVNAERKTIDKEVRVDIAKKCAEECVVLLKNDGALPLSQDKTVLIGEYAEKLLMQGGGSSRVNARNAKTLKDVLSFEFSAGYKGAKRSRRLERRALKLCANAGNIIYCMGAEGDFEGYDRKNINMPENQTALLEKLCRLKKRVIVVLFGGCAVDTSWDKNVGALLYAGLSGESAAEAVADILNGKANPSGKLAETFPENVQDVPSTQYFNENPYYTVYREGMRVGYLSGVKAKYPFGFGLSYTRFEYSDLGITERGVSFTVANTGGVYGGETVQMYIEYPESANAPAAFLKGFEKVFLNADESKRIEILFDEFSFRSYDAESKKWVCVGGEYKIHIAASSADIRLSGTLNKEGVKGVCQPRTETLKPEPYKINKDENGRVTADIHTPLCELKNARGAFGRLFARLSLFAVRNKPTVYGSMEYLPMRTLAQFGKMSEKTLDGLLLTFNGKFFKGIFKMLKKDRNKRYD